MNSEFQERALQKVDPKTVWSAETDPLHTRTPRPKRSARDVLGHEPLNRHERRKAAKLLRRKV